MIGYLKGNLIYADNGVVVLEVNGVGYEITCSSAAFSAITEQGENQVYTYMAVKEDGVSLYGFISMEEKQMFLKLITVSGVGPKMGITVLSNMNLNDLAMSIASSDIKTLSSIKGLGKKTAERIIVELREKMTEEIKLTPKDKQVKREISGVEEDAVIALMSLGFNKSECITAIDKAKDLGATDLKGIIALALKNIR